ncbi:MAG: wax ester/triacylglycerol synthase family O-acyltransferase [Microthrixaceae bacterium]
MERITGADALFLETETSTMLMHVVGVLVLDPTGVKGWSTGRVLEVMEERIHLIAPFRRRVLSVPAGLDHPRWIEDPDFALDNHVGHHTLDAPGDARALATFAGDVASRQLPRDRPLWEMWVVDGLADGSVALVSKVHHAVMDGAAGGELMASLFDLSADGDPVQPPEEEWSPAPQPDARDLAADALGAAVTRVGRLPGTLVRSAGALAEATRTSMSRQASGDVQNFAPSTPFNGRLTKRRTVALNQCRLDDLRRARTAFGTTVNDVVLAAVTASLRRYLADRDALPSGPLLASVPMSLRTEADEGRLGNRTANLMVPLPVGLADPVEALQAIRAHTSEAKAAPKAFGPDLMADWVDLTSSALIRGAALAYSNLGVGGLHPSAFNLVMSNVPGPPIPLFLGGARVTATYPMGPLIANTGLNITVLSQCDDLNVGVIACPDLVDDVDAIGAGFVAAVRELAELADRVDPEGSSDG